MNPKGPNDLLWNALQSANAVEVERALKEGADPRQPLDHPIPGAGFLVGDAPLHGAFKPYLKKNKGPRGQMWSQWEGVGKIVQMLLEHGADATALDNNGYTPLMVCCKHEMVKIDAGSMARLVEASKSVIGHAEPRRQLTALHLAAADARHDVAKKLLRGGADANAVDETGQTAAWGALSRIDCEHIHASPKVANAWKTVDAWLAAGGDINLPDHTGRTAGMAHPRIPLEDKLQRGVDPLLSIQGHSVLSETLRFLEDGTSHWMYGVPSLQILARIPGVDWSTPAPRSGKTLREMLAEIHRDEVRQEVAEILASLDHGQLDGTTPHPHLAPRKNRL